MTSRRLVILLTVSIAAGAATVYFIPKPLPEMSQKDLIGEVQSGYVHEVVIVDKEVVTGISSRRGPFRVPLRGGAGSLIDQLSAMGVDLKYETTPLGLI